MTVVQPRDLHARGQQFQEGQRDTMINNVFIRSPRQPGLPIGMADQNEDDLNVFSRKTLPDLLEAAFEGSRTAYWESGRPTADILLPMLTEHTVGQLMQMLMLATVVEARLMGVNPYSRPGLSAYQRQMQTILRAD